MSKKILFTFCVLLSVCVAAAQSYHNEWIDYSKTYYKFNLGPFGYDIVGAPVKSGAVRITPAVLAAAGLGSTPVQHLQLWRNGTEVAFYTSKESGVMGANDYIEFWGEINDGVLDKELYKQDTLQLSDYWSLQSDTAAYFFTVNSAGANKRLVTVSNNAGSSTLQPEASFPYTVGRYYRSMVNGGYFAQVGNEPIYSCAYDKGEGFTSRSVTPASSMPQNFYTLRSAAAGTMTAHVTLTGNAPNRRTVNILLNGESIARPGVDYFDAARVTVPNLPVSKLKGDTAIFTIQNESTNSADAIRVATIALTYPRLFHFDNSTSFRFTLAPSAGGRLLSITNFSNGTAPPVLYDLANGTRYVADTQVPNTFRFLLQPSTVPYQLAMVRGDGSAAAFIPAVQPKSFTNFALAANAGDYLIITNKLLYGSGNTNYIEQYRAYRSSAAGGGFNVKVIDIDDLTDQFAWGVQKHPLSIKYFLRYARSHFVQKPAFVFLIGKGVVYSSYNKGGDTKTYADQLNLVPTWGNPGSDNFLASENTVNPVPLTPIGRLSAVTAAEVGNYLDKVKHYEQLQKSAPSLPLAERSYMKRVIQIAGANDPTIAPLLANYTNQYTDIIADTFFGATVHNYLKSEDPAGYPQAVVNFKSVYESGSSLVEYFGHTSTTTLDFNLDNPDAYNTGGKYPIFIVNGCKAGNMFDYDANRFNLRTAITEKFILEPGKGAVGYLSTSSWGIVQYLDLYTRKMYEAMGQKDYGKPFGVIAAHAMQDGLSAIGEGDYLARYHAEEYAYHGDPAIRLNTFDKPDYAVDTSLLTTQPASISVADQNFTVKIKLYNLGKAVNDSVHLKVYRVMPNGDSTAVFSNKIGPVKGLDSLSLTLPIVPNRDTATEYISVFVNDDFKVEEMSRSNNYASVPVSFFQHEIRPVFPYNYSIVKTPQVTLSASTANALAARQTYLMEMDTTALFNSPLRKTGSVTTTGGLVEFKNVQLSKAAVYYWRVSQAGTGSWNNFSFTYDPQGNDGFEQAHYFQHTESKATAMHIDSARRWQLDSALVNIFVQQGIYPYSAMEPIDQSIMLNGQISSAGACIGHSIIFNTFDPITFKPQPNLTNPFGAAAPCGTLQQNNFEYVSTDAAGRNKAFQFLNSLPKGTWVIAKRNYDKGDADWASVWAKDSLIYTNGTLYQSFKNMGLPIDSFNRPRTFVFLFRKEDTTSFKPVAYFSQGVYDRVTFSMNLPVKDTAGVVASPIFGPAAAWNNVEWNGFATDANDYRKVSVYGIDTAANETLLYVLDSSQHQLDVSGVNAAHYPYARLKLTTGDSVLATPYQLQQWRVSYKPVPEGAVAPNLGVQLPDSLLFNHGTQLFYDTLKGYVVFKNVSRYAFKPLKVALTLTDEMGQESAFAVPATRAVPAGDTVHIRFNVDVRALPRGLYNLRLTVNPNGDQPEQFTFNNTLYKYLYIGRDVVLPVQVIQFGAQQQGAGVLVSWRIANEQSVTYYEVEHSLDGVHFTMVGRLKASGSNAYQFEHNGAAAGTNYYRLKVLDANGAVQYSKLALVQLAPVIKVSPNPFVNEVNIVTGGAFSQVYTVVLFSATGQQLLRKTFSGNTTLNTAALAAGTYLLQVGSSTATQTFTLQKRHR